METNHTIADYQRALEFWLTAPDVPGTLIKARICHIEPEVYEIVRSALTLAASPPPFIADIVQGPEVQPGDIKFYPAASDTHVFVPREPTEAMLLNGFNAYQDNLGTYLTRMRLSWDEMITAAEGK